MMCMCVSVCEHFLFPIICCVFISFMHHFFFFLPVNHACICVVYIYINIKIKFIFSTFFLYVFNDDNERYV